MYLRTILLLCLALSGCWHNPWTTTPASHPDLGPSVWVARDTSLKSYAPRSDWHTWVVIQNNGPYPVNVAFRTGADTVDFHEAPIAPGEKVALRVGPGNVEFLFRRTNPKHPSPQPSLIESITEDELGKRYPLIRRY